MLIVLNYTDSYKGCFRHYDPSTGRFLQQDPDPGKLAVPATFLSKYVYTANNPVMFSDPSGKFFGWDDLAYILIVSLAQTVAENHYLGGNFLDQFGKNIALSTVMWFAGYWFGGTGGYGMSWIKATESFSTTLVVNWAVYDLSMKKKW